MLFDVMCLFDDVLCSLVEAGAGWENPTPQQGLGWGRVFNPQRGFGAGGGVGEGKNRPAPLPCLCEES